MTSDNDSAQPLGHRSLDREVWVGLFVIAGIAAVLFCLFTFTDAALFRGRYIVTTVVKDAGGIRRGDPVQMRGVNIGRIQKFLIVNEGVEIHLEIEGEFSIPDDSRVELSLGSLMGGMVADVRPGSSSTMLRRGGKLPGATGRQFTDAANDIAKDTQTALDRVKTILSDRTAKNVETSSAELVALIKDLRKLTADERKQLDEVMKSVQAAAEAAQKTASKPELDEAIQHLNALSRRLEETSAHVERASTSMEAILGRVERGEGTLGRLSTDTTLYDNVSKAAAGLNQAAAELTSLTADIRKQPKKYLKLSLF